jgi:type II secretory pathway pseudopilin PulG
MGTLSSVLLGFVLLLALYRLGGTRDRRFQRRAVAIALVLILAVIVWMVLGRGPAAPSGVPATTIR